MNLEEVFILDEAFNTMENHSKISIETEKEIGGILLGKPGILYEQKSDGSRKNKDGKLVLWVLKAIKGHCISSRSHVYIESSTYDDVWNEIDANTEENLVVVVQDHPETVAYDVDYTFRLK